ncbi:MAG: hypothetical protein ACQCN6_01665 [Candidatus Bathyarchaeia archaeon]|jgi:hypothetical protein
MARKFRDGFGKDVTAYVADLEAKAERLKVVEAELAKLKPSPLAAAVASDSTKVAISKKKK